MSLEEQPLAPFPAVADGARVSISPRAEAGGSLPTATAQPDS